MGATSRIARGAIDAPVDPYRLRFFIALRVLAAGGDAAASILAAFSAG